MVTARNQAGQAVNREMVWTGRRPTEEIALRNFQRAINRQKIMILKAFPPIHQAMQDMSMRQWWLIERYELHDNNPDRLEDVNQRLVANGHPPLKSLNAYRSELSRARRLVRSTWPLGDITGTISGDFRYSEVPEEPPCPIYAERPDHWLEAYTIPRAHPEWLWPTSGLEIAETQKITKERISKLGLWDTALTLRGAGLTEGNHWSWIRPRAAWEAPPKQPRRKREGGGWMRFFAIPRDYPKTYAGFLPTGTAKPKLLRKYRLNGDKYDLVPICCEMP